MRSGRAAEQSLRLELMLVRLVHAQILRMPYLRGSA